jgi:hypothetical protein
VLGLLAMAALAMLWFGGEFFLEWYRLGRPGPPDLTWAGENHGKLVDILSPMARAYNNILAMLLATIGLAIPLTANMHTPKLIDMFLRDRINQFILGFCALGAANVLWVAYIIGPGFAPMWAYRAAIIGALAGWVALVPYFFYVVRFLDPSNILARLKHDVLRGVDRARRGKLAPAAAHDLIQERLHQIGTIILKSIDRADRGVALEGVWSLKQILDYYGERKPSMPAGWFKVERKDFVGMSAEALAIVNEERIWFEHRAMSQLFLAYQSALAKTQDVISSLSDAARIIAVHAAQRGDERALELAVRFFNNYVREGIKRKEIHAVYDIFYQYRLLAGALCDRPQLLRQIGQFFRIYGDAAVANGLTFVPQILGFDLGWMVARAYDTHSPAAPDLLEDLLGLNHLAANDPRSLLLKAKVILGGYFVETGRTAEAERVRRNLADVPAATLATVERDLMRLAERSFWEVTDRQVGFEWVPPEKRPHVHAFVETLRHT